MELYKARNAIRPVQEKEVEQQLEGTMHEKPSLIMLLSAKQEASRLLGEDAENRQARQMIMRRNDYRNAVVSFCNTALLLISVFSPHPLQTRKSSV